MRTSTVPVAVALMLAAGPAARAADRPVDYNRDVKPILADHCYPCHGPDAGQRKAKLRLDVREIAVKDVIVPGKAADSELARRIASSDPQEVMPPAKSLRRRLSPAEVDVLRRWIDQGAKFDSHWAYAKPTRPAVPAVAPGAYAPGSPPINPIDHFIAAGHAAHKLRPAPEADRVTLLRRLSLDLTGLPPTPAEVDAFLADTSPNAYEKQVERLLASPHFGERMALEWLDAVRYADTGGYHSDNHRDVWLYRDWVIDAFNRNVPFDRFTVEQVAGDLLPNPTDAQRIASGYNRLLMTTEEGGAQAKEYTAKYTADRVRNASSVWLAATMGCCECHSHKFDPFTQKDFYRFAAFFADVTETAVGRQSQTPIPSPEQATRLKQLDADLAAQRAKLTQVTPELAAARDAWELQSRADLAKKPPQWLPVKPATAVSRGGATLAVQGDLSVLASGKNPDKDTYTVTLATDLPHLTGLRLEALTHPSLANKSLSRANGNFVLTGVEVQARGKGPEKPQPVKLVKALADYEQAGFPAAHAIDADPATGWAVEGHVKVADRQAVFVFDKPLAAGPGTTLTVTLHFQSQYPAHTIGRFRLAVTSAEQPALGEAGLPADVLQALTTDPAKRTPAQAERLAAHFRGTSPLLASVRERVAALEGERDRLVKSFPTTLVTVAMATPRTVRVLPRGNWLDDSGEVVTPDVPTFLTPLNLPDRRAGRLDLARWLTSPDNPLTARVFVNRLWKLTFGQGIVRSIDDFGSQGTPPTHPELLDWLASEFMHPAADAADSPGGWDVKHMVRLMVLSRAYRQSSHADRAVRERDPGNLWLARQGRFRLDAELVRDNALAVSGLLTEKVGGPSVKPYCPPGYWSYMNFPTREYVADHGEAEYRRGLYTYWCRTFAHPSLLAFDAPTREECTVARPNSNTPLQALVLLNDPTYVEAARAFAARIIREGGPSTEGRLNWAFKRALARGARPEELKPLTDLLEKHRREYAAGPEAAKKLLGTGDAPPPKDVPPEELAAWASVARVILNLHETVTRE